MADLSKMSTEELLALREQATKQPEPQQQDLSKIPTEQLVKMRQQAIGQSRPKKSEAESFGRGLAQGASLGFADELTAGVGAVKDWAAGKLGMRGDIGLGDAYNSYIKNIRAQDDAAKADNPKSFLGGNLTGGIGATLVPGVGIAKGAGAAQSIGKAAALGATAGAGTSEASLTESPETLKQFGKDVALGGTIGAVAQGGFHLLGKGMTALKPSELRKLSNVKALKAGGAIGSDLKKLGPERVQEIGEELHKKGVVKAFQSIEDFAKKATEAKEEAGQAIGNALESVDDLVKQAKELVDAGAIGGNLPQQGKDALKASIDKQFQFNMSRIGQRIQKELIEPNANNPLLKGELNKLAAIADDFGSKAATTMKEGNVIKGTQGAVTNFNSETVPQAFKKQIYGIIKTELDDIVAKTGNLEMAVGKGGGNTLGKMDVAARNQSVSDAYQGAKKTYGAMKQAEKISTDRLGQTQGNREISLTDTIAGAAGLATGNPANAVLLGGANKLMRQYGDSVMSVGARRAADLIEKGPQMLGKYYDVLIKAANQGGPALESTHLSLMKEPDYARIIQNYEKSQAFMRRMGRGK